MNNSRSLFLTLCASALLIVSSLSACKKDSDNKDTAAPVACFTTSDTVVLGQPVSFTNCSEHATQFSWQFGDGSASSAAQSPSYTYTQAGTYTVILAATNINTAKTEIKSKTIVVFDPTVVVDPRQKFLSAYSAVEDGSISGPYTFDLTISAGSGSNDVWIDNMYGEQTFHAKATVSGNAINVPTQIYDASANIQIKGDGTLSGNKINITYTVWDPSQTDVVTAIWTKK